MDNAKKMYAMTALCILCIAHSASATTIGEGHRGCYECVDIEHRETITIINIEENVVATSTGYIETALVWQVLGSQYQDQYQGQVGSIFDRHYYDDGTCEVVVASGQSGYWHDRWYNSDDVTLTSNGDSTIYVINDIEECLYLKEKLAKVGNNNDTGINNYRGDGWSSLSIGRWITTYSRSYVETFNEYTRTWTEEVCTWACGGVETEPVPEPATMLLFGIGIAGMCAVKRIKKERS